MHLLTRLKPPIKTQALGPSLSQGQGAPFALGQIYRKALGPLRPRLLMRRQALLAIGAAI